MSHCTDLRIDDPGVRALLERLPLAVTAVDANGRVIFVNARATQMSGYTIEDVPTLAAWRERAFPDPSYRQTINSRWDAAVAEAARTGREIEPVDYTAVTLDGEERHVTVSGLPMRGGFLAIFVDHTERHRSELSRLQSEQRFRDVVNAAGEYVWECDLDCRYTYLSNKVQEIFGYRPSEMLGRRPSDFMVPGEHADVFPQLDALRATDGCYSGLEYRSISKEGRVFWQSISSVQVRDANGRLIAFRGTGRDITDRKLAELEREQLEVQVREAQKLQAVGTLAGGIAHEFNNLLAVVLGHISLAKIDPALNPMTQEHLRAIEGAAQDARQLVQQMLAFGRRQSRDLQPVALAPLIRECLALLEPSLPAGIVTEFIEDPAAPRVLGDPLQLKQVLLNLGINAAYAMRDRPGRLTVRLASAKLSANAPTLHRRLVPGHHAVVTVADEGCGMAPATVARIFEPFFTTKPVGQGTGLGLSVVDGIIDTHGGGILVHSVPGEGSTFSIYLRATTLPVEQNVLAAAPATVPVAGVGRHILYVDDQASLLPMIRSMIESLGYEVTTHADPTAALAAFRGDPRAFDVVVTDYKMPGMTGLDLAKAVRRLRTDAPIALISGYASGEFVDEARRVGIDEFIYKPSIADELGSVIERLLARVPTSTEPAPTHGPATDVNATAR